MELLLYPTLREKQGSQQEQPRERQIQQRQMTQVDPSPGESPCSTPL